MKTLLFAPLFFLLQPLCLARVAPESAVTPLTAGTATANTSGTRAEADSSAKKNSNPPASPAPSAPKRHRPAQPAYLFME